MCFSHGFSCLERVFKRVLEGFFEGVRDFDNWVDDGFSNRLRTLMVCLMWFKWLFSGL